jgi:NTE family protein
LLRSDVLAKHEIVGLSGTSGGAVCALLAWYALLKQKPEYAGQLLDDFWNDNAANSLRERLANAWILWSNALEHFVTPAVSPYDTPVSLTAMNDFRTMLLRRLDFDDIAEPIDSSQPILVIGGWTCSAASSRRSTVGET